MSNQDDSYKHKPIRTYREVAEILRARGDKTITTQHVYWYEQSAFRKLRRALARAKL